MDQTYQVLKRANEIAKPGGGESRGGPVVRVVAPTAEETPPARSPARPTAGLAVAPQPISSSSGLAPHPSSLASPLEPRRRPPAVACHRSVVTRDGRPAASIHSFSVASSCFCTHSL